MCSDHLYTAKFPLVGGDTGACFLFPEGKLRVRNSWRLNQAAFGCGFQTPLEKEAGIIKDWNSLYIKRVPLSDYKKDKIRCFRQFSGIPLLFMR
ncbi:MAG: hypothetical protein DCC43_09485 [Candidatus Brocadia sp.]|nr:hypothetical protein [Candidatus Brocadia sp. AMX3]OQZ00765.1 MAG: hypothetical protein B6D35_05340 [Candidatus Brocadia sp. UTAMX2]RIJ98657.1 MAG: hypothetical protein DCC43_09485 [Candidatus Brocadia sp.]